jgi:hypothetical protein
MKAIERAYLRQDQIRYKKVGRKYIQDNDPCAYDGLGEGWWLVKVSKGCTSIRAAICPAKAELQAAIKDKEDEIIEVIRKASEARPQRRPISEQAQKDWKWFIARNGGEFNTLEYPSIQENAEKIIEKLLEK